ncbi:hypothetical protein [Burkholderia territorii]|nr:hypothetical protein [Burkholderia territorii]
MEAGTGNQPSMRGSASGAQNQSRALATLLAHAALGMQAQVRQQVARDFA